MMDARSEANLVPVAPDLATRVRAAADKLAAQGTFLLVVSGLRTASEQNTLYAQGRTAPGHIVTNARAGESMHNYGLAVDVVPYLKGNGGNLNWQVSTPQFQAMVAAMKAQGLVWGGDWKSLADYDHFQIGGLPNSPSASMRAAYTDGSTANLNTIWQTAAQGKFTA